MLTDNFVKFERRMPQSPPPPGDFNTASSLEKCDAMLEHLLRQTFPGPEPEAYAVLLLVNLNDLVTKAKAEGNAITFNDDVELMDGVSNITDLVTKMRNAAVHVRSRSKKIGESAFSFIRIIGYLPNACLVDGHTAGCNYADDVALYYGKYRLYLHRHVRRLLKELAVIYAGK